MALIVALFIVVPIIELYVIIQVGQLIGIAMLPGRNPLLLVGILLLKRSDLVLVLCQLVLSLCEIEAVFGLFKKSIS